MIYSIIVMMSVVLVGCSSIQQSGDGGKKHNTDSGSIMETSTYHEVIDTVSGGQNNNDVGNFFSSENGVGSSGGGKKETEGIRSVIIEEEIPVIESVQMQLQDLKETENETEYQKVRSQNIISKNDACTRKDGDYQEPLEINRPGSEIINERFHKKGNFLVHSFGHYDDNQLLTNNALGAPRNMTFFIYNCISQKNINLSDLQGSDNYGGIELESVYFVSDDYLLSDHDHYEGWNTVFTDIKKGIAVSLDDKLNNAQGIQFFLEQYQEKIYQKTGKREKVDRLLIFRYPQDYINIISIDSHMNMKFSLARGEFDAPIIIGSLNFINNTIKVIE